MIEQLIAVLFTGVLPVGLILAIPLLFRRVVEPNEVHIVQSSRGSLAYGLKDSTEGNAYYEWPHWIPKFGVRVVDLSLAVFDLSEEEYEAYDEGKVPFVVDVVGGSHALSITAELRAAGIPSDRGFDNRSMKAQMKLANRSDARVALIVGDDEAANDTVIMKPMARDAGPQQTIPRSDLISHLKDELRKQQ